MSSTNPNLDPDVIVDPDVDPSVETFPEQALRSDAEQFRRLVESASDYAIFLLDRDGFVRTWNVGAERIKGYQSQEIVGQHFPASTHRRISHEDTRRRS